MDLEVSTLEVEMAMSFWFAPTVMAGEWLRQVVGVYLVVIVP